MITPITKGFGRSSDKIRISDIDWTKTVYSEKIKLNVVTTKFKQKTHELKFKENIHSIKFSVDTIIVNFKTKVFKHEII